MESTCEVLRLGQMAYQEAWQLQDRLAAGIARGERPPALLLLEHPHTFTFGRRGHAENLLWDEAECARRGVSVYWVDRGGDVTYHGPGQLVGYPLLPLAPGGLLARSPEAGASPRLPQVDYVGYLRKLERVLIRALLAFGVIGERIEGLTGVWVQPEAVPPSRTLPPALQGRPAKIAAIGVKVDAQGISRHGFALNVNPEMSYWEGIVGCGLRDAPVASLAELLPEPPPMEAVMDAVTEAFGEVFDFNLLPV